MRKFTLFDFIEEFWIYIKDARSARKELRERFGNKDVLINPTQADMAFVSNVAYKYGVCIGRKLSGGMAIVDGKIQTHKSLVITGRL